MTDEQPFSFPEGITITEAVGQAIGRASMCWETPEGAGVFDDAQASETMTALLNVLAVDPLVRIAVALEHLAMSMPPQRVVMGQDVTALDPSLLAAEIRRTGFGGAEYVPEVRG